MNKETMGIAAALVGLLWWRSRSKPAQASATAPAPTGWLEHAPVDPSNWFGDMQQRLNGGDLFGSGAAHPVVTGNPVTQDMPTGYYVDKTNAGGSLLNANVAPDAYGATVGKDPMLALFGTVMPA